MEAWEGGEQGSLLLSCACLLPGILKLNTLQVAMASFVFLPHDVPRQVIDNPSLGFLIYWMGVASTQ
jgi:hypothetical protein